MLKIDVNLSLHIYCLNKFFHHNIAHHLHTMCRVQRTSHRYRSEIACTVHACDSKHRPLCIDLSRILVYHFYNARPICSTFLVACTRLCSRTYRLWCNVCQLNNCNHVEHKSCASYNTWSMCSDCRSNNSNHGVNKRFHYSNHCLRNVNLIYNTRPSVNTVLNCKNNCSDNRRPLDTVVLSAHRSTPSCHTTCPMYNDRQFYRYHLFSCKQSHDSSNCLSSHHQLHNYRRVACNARVRTHYRTNSRRWFDRTILSANTRCRYRKTSPDNAHRSCNRGHVAHTPCRYSNACYHSARL